MDDLTLQILAESLQRMKTFYDTTPLPSYATPNIALQFALSDTQTAITHALQGEVWSDSGKWEKYQPAPQALETREVLVWVHPAGMIREDSDPQTNEQAMFHGYKRHRALIMEEVKP